MSLIPAEHLRALRNDLPILAVIEHLRIPTKKRGTRLTWRCPQCARFHTATNPRTNLARCFSCKRNFNPIDLVMAERGSSFLETVEYLSHLAPALSAPPSRAARHRTRVGQRADADALRGFSAGATGNAPGSRSARQTRT